MSYKIYGIPNCGSVKKALDFFNQNNIDYSFINFKKEPITETLIENWIKQLPPEKFINTKGTTWRQLDEKTKKLPLTADSVKALVLDNNSIVKRPVITQKNKIKSIGFDAENYQKLYL